MQCTRYLLSNVHFSFRFISNFIHKVKLNVLLSLKTPSHCLTDGDFHKQGIQENPDVIDDVRFYFLVLYFALKVQTSKSQKLNVVRTKQIQRHLIVKRLPTHCTMQFARIFPFKRPFFFTFYFIHKVKHKVKSNTKSNSKSMTYLLLLSM